MKQNKDGLTFSEWINASQAFGKRFPIQRAKKAWENGVDPCEWAC